MKLSRLNTTSNFLYSYFSYHIPTCYPTYLNFLLVLPHPTFFETLPKSSPKIIMPSQMTKQRFHHPAKHVTAIFCSPLKDKSRTNRETANARFHSVAIFWHSVIASFRVQPVALRAATKTAGCFFRSSDTKNFLGSACVSPIGQAVFGQLIPAGCLRVFVFVRNLLVFLKNRRNFVFRVSKFSASFHKNKKNIWLYLVFSQIEVFC